MNERIAELSKSDDPEIQVWIAVQARIQEKFKPYLLRNEQDLFKGASENDEASVLELKNLAARDLYPGKKVAVGNDTQSSTLLMISFLILPQALILKFSKTS